MLRSPVAVERAARRNRVARWHVDHARLIADTGRRQETLALDVGGRLRWAVGDAELGSHLLSLSQLGSPKVNICVSSGSTMSVISSTYW